MAATMPMMAEGVQPSLWVALQTPDTAGGASGMGDDGVSLATKVVVLWECAMVGAILVSVVGCCCGRSFRCETSRIEVTGPGILGNWDEKTK